VVTVTELRIGALNNMERFMLEAALTSLTIKKCELDAQIGQVEDLLAGRSITAKTKAPRGKRARVPDNADGSERRVARVMSKAGRERIAAAQVARWKKVRREKKAALKAKEQAKVEKKAVKASKKKVVEIAA
jgi:hypothetical protein